MTSQQITRLKKQLKKRLGNNIIDIFIIGSSIKNKLSPRDIDIIMLLKEKSYKGIENDLFEISEDIKKLGEIHIEPLFLENIFSEKIFLTIIHEGISVRHGKKISELLKINSFALFSYSLKNLDKISKVKFAYALYGRKKDGILYREKGKPLGQGSFLVPTEKEEIFKELFKSWKVNYSSKRAFVNY